MLRLIASFFGSGLILRSVRGSDSGSGTVGGVVAAGLALWLGRAYGWAPVAVVAGLLFVVGVVVTSRLYEGAGDAGWIVIDEAAGAFVALVGVTALPAAMAAFAAFRVADIFKKTFPGVIRAESLFGGWGVMADDVVAGLYGLAVGHLVQWLV